MLIGFIERLGSFAGDFYVPNIQVIDLVEIFLISMLLYFFFVWMQRTRAYSLLRGILVVAVFVLVAAAFRMNTILWILSRIASVAMILIMIIFQPEIRKALESLGTRSMFSRILPFETGSKKDDVISDKSINEIIHAVDEMSEVRTGALIVIEQKVLLDEYINTGINIDAVVSSQLLVNMFEHNTPLHDGAVIVRQDRINAATCYLPLSDNARISKRYGTRHRAGLGISEVSDAFTIIVSEESGRVSIAYMGALQTGITSSNLREQLHLIQKHHYGDREERGFKLRIRNKNHAKN